MKSVHQSAVARNNHPTALLPPVRTFRPASNNSLSPGAREIHRRTRWSPSLCNAIASAWSFGTEMEG